MKITLLGVLGFVAVGALLLYVALQIQKAHQETISAGYPHARSEPARCFEMRPM